MYFINLPVWSTIPKQLISHARTERYSLTTFDVSEAVTQCVSIITFQQQTERKMSNNEFFNDKLFPCVCKHLHKLNNANNQLLGTQKELLLTQSRKVINVSQLLEVNMFDGLDFPMCIKCILNSENLSTGAFIHSGGMSDFLLGKRKEYGLLIYRYGDLF